MASKDNKLIKYNSIPQGKVCLALMYICAFFIALTGTVMLFAGDDIRIGIAIWAIVLFVFVPVIISMHYNNAADCVVFTDDKIKGKCRTLTWDSVCLTVHCHKFSGSRTVFAWLYFDDHYLTEKEVRSWRVRRQGLCIRLNYERTQFILSKCKNKIETLNDRFSHYSDLICSVYMFNDILEKSKTDE